MKRLIICAFLIWSAGFAFGIDRPAVEVDDFSLRGRIDGENIVFDLTFVADVHDKDVDMLLLEGEAGILSGGLDGKEYTIRRQGKRLSLDFAKGGRVPVEISFASRAAQQGDWRETSFRLPEATIRKVVIVCDRADLEVDFPTALKVSRAGNDEEQTEITAYLGVSDTLSLRWKPEVRKLAAATVVSSDAYTLASASVGVLRQQSVFNYKLAQGTLERLSFQLPSDLSVTQVKGLDILRWTIDESGDGRRLNIDLNRAQQDGYRLIVESEVVLPDFPCEFELPMPRPLDVIRASGFLMIGTDSAVKLLVDKAAGLTQIDLDAFPSARMSESAERLRSINKVFAYQYANMPFELAFNTDDIVPAYSSEDRIVVGMQDDDLALNASIELDVRDAPLREIAIETEPDWIVANVEGSNVGDYTVRDEGGKRLITVVFREAAIGKMLLDVKMERTLAEGREVFQLPRFAIAGAESERGFLVLSAEQGVRFEEQLVENLREIHTKSVPMRVEETRLAYRFKNADWSLRVKVQATDPSIYCEIFHLVSLGESALYGSSSLTYHVGEAPVRTLKVKVPESYRHVEFTGRDIRRREKSSGVWELTLQEKVIGDYTLLVTYDREFDYQGGRIVLGGIASEGIAGETGFIALAGRASLNVSEVLARDESIIPIDSAEIPEEYRLLINDPVLRAYKYIGLPHEVALDLQSYETQSLLGQVTDHTTLETRISAEGESVTQATYFVKNTSSQYLSIKLPSEARLWSVAVDGKEVQALDTAEDSGVLIPLERNIDPNQPLKVVLEYAESNQPLGWRSAIALRSPICAVQSVFTRWNISVPEDFSVARVGGNMMESEPVSAVGILALLKRSALTGLHLFPWGIPFAVLVVFTCIIAFQRGRGTRAVAPSVLCVMALLPALFIAALIAADVGLLPPGWGKGFLSAGVPRSLGLTKVVSLAGSGIEAELKIMPAWLGSEGSLVSCLLALVAGVALIVGTCLSRRNRLALAALGATIMTWGLAQTAATLAVSSVLLVVLLPLALLVIAAMWFYRGGRRNRKQPQRGRMDSPSAATSEGGEAVALCLVVLLLGAVGVRAEVAPDSGERQSTPVESVVTDIEIAVDAPARANGEDEKAARLSIECAIETDTPCAVKILSAATVLLDYEIETQGWSLFGGDDAALESRADGSYLVLRKRGEYRLSLSALVPVEEDMGSRRIALHLPPNLKNELILRIPEQGYSVDSARAVYLETAPAGAGSRTRAVFGGATSIALLWQPQVRKAELEDVVFFANTRTEVLCESGVVNLDNRIQYQIAQGQIQSLELQVPTAMSVTAVEADGLSTWRFDSETGLLEAMLEKPVSGGFVLRVVTQIAREGLPYQVSLGLPKVSGAEYQRGSLALAVPGNVQVLVEGSSGLHSMNVGDFERTGLRASAQRENSLKRAFRYHRLPVALTIAAEEVLPEIRVDETASIDVSSERIVLSSKLSLLIAKAGLFSVELGIPDGYEVEALTGPGISHWDEVGDDGNRLAVHFSKQKLGDQAINLVLTRLERELGERIALPRVRVADAVKHKGTLTVSGERGVRLATVERRGVSELNPRELGVRMPGYLAFRILRPDWSVDLSAEILDPVVKVELLQRVDLNEGVLSGRCFVRYRIDNAGCKRFRLRSPRPDVGLNILGRDIADVKNIDSERGIWQVDLHNKVEREYNLEVGYQIPFDPKDGRTRVEPLIPVDVDSSKGYLAVMADGRLQVRHGEVPGGLREENARSIPAHFGAGDLSDAILCYRVADGDYELDISVIRHDSATVLPASVESVGLDSVVSSDDQVVTRMQVDLDAGDMRLLKMQLPSGSRVWSVYVNGKSVRPLLQESAHLIPLEATEGGQLTAVEVIYGGQVAGRQDSARYAISGPRLGLPLNNVQWNIYMPPDARYYDFGGSMNHDDDAEPVVAEYSARLYTSAVQQEAQRNLKLAEEVLTQGEKFAQAGRQRQAKLAFQSAMNYSKGDKDFNADARIQYRNIAKKQAVVGLVNRRARLKQSINIQDEMQAGQMDGFNRGNWSAEYENRIEQSLSAKDNRALNIVAEKIIGQQAAAVAEAPAIRLTLPTSGKRLVFERAIQIEPDAEMQVDFKVSAGRWARRFQIALALAGLFCCYLIFGRIIGGEFNG